jgi:hypothetical protein
MGTFPRALRANENFCCLPSQNRPLSGPLRLEGLPHSTRPLVTLSPGAALFPATSPCGRPCAEGFHVAGGDPAPICCGAAVRCSLFGRFLPKLGRPSGRPFSSMWVSARRQRGAAHRRPPIGKGRHDYPGFNEARGSPASSWNDFRLSAHESLLSWWSQGELNP